LANGSDLKKALKLNGTEFEGQTLKVDQSARKDDVSKGVRAIQKEGKPGI